MFRPQALAHHQDRLGGDVLATRLPGQRWWVALAVLMALAVVAFGLLAGYTRKEHVAGYLAPSSGLVKIYTPQVGTVVQLAVAEGQAVRRGDVLMELSSDRDSTGQHAAQAAVQQQLQARRDSLRREQGKQAEIDDLGAMALAQRVRTLELQAAQTRSQLALQRQRQASVERGLARQQQLVDAHFVTEAALQQKQEELIDQHSQIAALERTHAALAGDLAAARADLAASALKRANNSAAYARQISELGQQITETETRRSVVITAPIDGTVTTLLTGLGQQAAPGTPLLSLLPAGSALQAELMVPTRAIGFIHEGQPVALRYQAFPYQRFGHHEGQVVQVGRTVIQPNESSLPLAVQEPVYRVTVRLRDQGVLAYGDAMPLRPGMLLDADVSIDRRSLVQWLFDPLLSVTGRV